MILSLIAAVAKNNVIGGGNTLLWNLPADMKHFRETTSGHPVIMGRKTFESIGRPLPNRRNIIITRDASYKKDGVEIVHSLDEAIALFKDSNEEVFVIGGGEIYKQAIEKADKLYITEVAQDFAGDTYFPEIDRNYWEESMREQHEPDDKNHMLYSFVIYTKKSA